MRDDNRDPEFSLDAQELDLHIEPKVLVERAEGLIEKHEARLDGKSAPCRNSLLLPPGQLLRQAVGKIRKLDQLQEFVDMLANFVPFRLAQLPIADVLFGEVREQRVVLEYEADIATIRRNIVDCHAIHQDTPPGLTREARNQAQDRRLAATARPEKRNDLARLHLEVDVVENPKRATGMAKPFNREAHAVSCRARKLLGRCRWACRRISDTLLSIKYSIIRCRPGLTAAGTWQSRLASDVRPTFAARSTCHRLISKRLSRIVHNVNLSWPQNISLRPASPDGGVKTGELAELDEPELRAIVNNNDQGQTRCCAPICDLAGSERTGVKDGRARARPKYCQAGKSRDGRLVPVEQRVLHDIVKAIYEQRLRAGTKLGEEALAAAFSVSRARIRRVLWHFPSRSWLI